MTNIKQNIKQKKRIAKMLMATFVMATVVTPFFAMNIDTAKAQEPEYKINLGNVDSVQNLNKLEGATYTVTQTKGAYNALTGKYENATLAPFDVTISSVPSVVPQEVRTSYENGVLKLTLPEGTYSIVQKTAPTGYYLKDGSVETIVVELPRTDDGFTLNNEVDVTPKSEEIRKELRFTKYSGRQDSTLDGATFKLYRTTDLTNPSPNYDEFNVKDNGLGARVSDENWDTDKLALKTVNGVFSVENLPYGKYYIQENTSPDTHVLSKEKVKFEVKQEGMDRLSENLTLSAEMNNFKVPNVDKVIDGAEDASTSSPKIVNNGEDINFTISVYLPKDIGTYNTLGVIRDKMDAKLTFKEITSIEVDYQDVSDLFNVQSNPSDENAVENLEITAKDVTQLDAYAGKVLTIKYKAFADADTPTGTTMVNNVEVADYANQWSVTGTTKDLTPPAVKTPSNTIKITKVDGTNNNVKLENVKFKLFKVDTNSVVANETLVGAEMTTNSEGVIEWTNLTNGTYHLRETDVSGINTGDDSKYRLLNKPIVIELNNTDGTVAVTEKTVENFKTNIFIPNTGTTGVINIMLLGSSLILGAALGFKKEEEN